MLNHLHAELTRTSLEDSRGGSTELASWFLIKSASPFLEVLTEFVSLGNVSDTTDPYVSTALGLDDGRCDSLSKLYDVASRRTSSSSQLGACTSPSSHSETEVTVSWQETSIL